MPRRKQSSIGGGIVLLLVVVAFAVGRGSSTTKPDSTAPVQGIAANPAPAPAFVPQTVQPTPQPVDTPTLFAKPVVAEEIPAEPDTDEDDLYPIDKKRPPIAERVWTSAEGGHQRIATFVAYRDGKVELRTNEGNQAFVPRTKLSQNDLDYLELIGQTDAKIIVGKVVGITDGDTISVLDESDTPQKIRLEGIDAPEAKQAYGSQARKILGEKVFQKVVRVEWRKKDRYGRLLGDVYLDGRHINQELVAEGLAWHFKKYSSDVRLAEAEKEARRSTKGLWLTAGAVSPWDYRAAEKVARDAKRKKVEQDRLQAAQAAETRLVEARAKQKAEEQAKAEAAANYAASPSYSSGSSSGGRVSVRGYTRKDGTYVRPHTRSAPKR